MICPHCGLEVDQPQPPKPPLTRQQRRVLDFYATYWDAKKLGPTLQEVADALGVSKVTIHQHVEQLLGRGYLQRIAGTGQSRAIQPT